MFIDPLWNHKMKNLAQRQFRNVHLWKKCLTSAHIKSSRQIHSKTITQRESWRTKCSKLCCAHFVHFSVNFSLLTTTLWSATKNVLVKFLLLNLVYKMKYVWTTTPCSSLSYPLTTPKYNQNKIWTKNFSLVFLMIKITEIWDRSFSKISAYRNCGRFLLKVTVSESFWNKLKKNMVMKAGKNLAKNALEFSKQLVLIFFRGIVGEIWSNFI